MNKGRERRYKREQKKKKTFEKKLILFKRAPTTGSLIVKRIVGVAVLHVLA